MRCCNALIAAEVDLNALDAKAGDGDTGTTLAVAARALLQDIDQLPFADPAQLYRALAQELSQTMGGSSGVLLAIFFAAAGEAAASSGQGLVDVLTAGLARLKEAGGAQPGDRTMVDALQPAIQALPHGLSEAARAARHGANRTATLLKANAGRAAYVGSEHLEGHVDPGAEAVARLFESLS